MNTTLHKMESITSVFSSYRSALFTVALGVCVYYVGKFLITCLNAAFILTKIMRGLKPFPGPDKHWLYGNLHQVRDVAKLKKSIHPKENQKQLFS